MDDLIDPETLKALDALPTPWDARDDFAEGSEELMAMLQYIDTIGEEYNKKNEYMDVLDYMDTLLDRQKQIVKFLKAPYATDSPESVETMAEYPGEDDCDGELVLKDGTVLKEKDTPSKFYWARKNLILHFTQHAEWRLICREVELKDAVKAAIAGRRIDFNLYWDPDTNIAAAVQGPRYNPKGGIQIQKVTTTFERSDARALKAYQALRQLFFNNASRDKYQPLTLQRPKGAPKKKKVTPIKMTPQWRPNKFANKQILDLTLDDLPDGMGNSDVQPSFQDLQLAQKLFKATPRQIGAQYNKSVLYDRYGNVVSPEQAKRDKHDLQQEVKLAELQIEALESEQQFQALESKRKNEQQLKQGKEKKEQQEEGTQKLSAENKTATFVDPPTNLFPTTVRQGGSNSSKKGARMKGKSGPKQT